MKTESPSIELVKPIKKGLPFFVQHGSEYFLLPQEEIKVTLSVRQQRLKRFFDIAASALAIVILTPFLLYVALRTSLSGKIIYSQERIGKNGKPFRIYKFRSMIESAEENGPQLSHEEDGRITSWGKTMRRWRLDELPQLWNILKGDMSIIGPRPERAFYINQIMLDYPYFGQLQKVKPGLSSWGMVRFGYAKNVEEIIARSRFDFYYLQNNSLFFDAKVILATLKKFTRK